MRIKSSQILTQCRIQLSGTEPWLDSIYADFRATDVPSHSAPITGYIDLSPNEKGGISVQGAIEYTPIVGCARCDKSIPWPISVQIGTIVEPATAEPLARDLNLKEDELESYHLDINDEFDIEMIINDAIQTAIPSQFLAYSENGKDCKICNLDLSGTKVYSVGESEAKSPFAALKKLKIQD